METINAIVYYMVVCLQSFHFRLFWAELLFLAAIPRRPGFWWRTFVWAPFLVAPLFFNNGFDQPFFKIHNYTWSFMLWFGYSIFAICLCHKLSAEQTIYIGVSAYSMQNLFANLKFFLLYRYSIDSTLVFELLTFVLMIGLYAAFYYFFVCSWNRQFKLELPINKMYLLVSAGVILLVLNVLSSYMINTNMDSQGLSDICLLYTICSVLILLLLVGVNDRTYFQYEKDTLRQLLREQERQRSLSERTISMINIKCHDMKHQFLELQQKADSSYVQESLDFIHIYDSFFKSGNKHVDLVLTEKSLLCQGDNIALSCTVDGAALDFMDATDIYTFFGNAMDNAIECEQKYPEEKRSITVNVRRCNGGFVSIVIENYNEEQPKFTNGVLKTSKADKQQHGFGTKSMRYIISTLYGGNIVMRQEGNTFIVSALLSQDAKRREQ